MGTKQKAEGKSAFCLEFLSGRGTWGVRIVPALPALALVSIVAARGVDIGRLDVRLLLVVLHEVRRHVDRLFVSVVEVVHPAAELRRNGTSRPVLVLLERGRLL